MSHLLGLTGSIGMGKSTTAAFFLDEGVPVWDADAAVHRLYAKGGAAVGQLESIFPAAIVENRVSRDVLKSIISDDPTALSLIEEIVHPLVALDRQSFISKSEAALLVFDIPLLFETGAETWLDSILVVSAPPEVQRERVMARPGMTEEQFTSILARQLPDTEKRRRADFVIETLNFEDTRAEVRRLIQKLRGICDARDRT